VAIVGDIPSGLPSVAVPDIALGDLWVLLPAAVGMMLVIFSEALGAGTTFADKHGYRIDSNQEMIALGVANLGSSLLGGLAGGGSLSQTAVNDGAGARSQLSSLIAAGLSLVTVIALTPLFADLPEAVLAALIIHALSHLMKVRQLIGFHHLSPQEFWLGIMTLGGVIVFDVLPGLILGVVISILLFVYRASQPKVSILGRTPNGEYVDVDRNPDGQTIPGVLVVRPDSPLFYANAQSVRDDIEGYATVADSGIRSVVIDLDSNDDLDITSAEHLDKLTDSLHRDHIQLRIAHLHQPARVIAAEIGLLDKIGEANVHPNIESAVQAADTGASDAGP
jgi:MFS superfamily sulfate permease-like transporter